ncbi:hypothetical protein [uncultured Massilia sp.]|uniref:hypothetical protein n=1 Tax=uncultured Massilia sp. TaxID=169973 RepID=UPI0025E17E2B|nr:hypothetical protein [uncultured Massilia sp.]
MIRIDKGPAPDELDALNATLTQENLAIHGKHKDKTKVSSAHKTDKAASDTIYITAAYRSAEVKNQLVQTHFGKCAYCETRILSVSHGDVEHFRPKAKYSGESQAGLGYFWLAYDWRNLFLACDMCNETYKGTYFALMPAVEGLIAPSNRLQVGEDVETNLEENAVLIDPAVENPRAYLAFDVVTGEAVSVVDERVSVVGARVGMMIRALGLNRVDLVTARHRHIAFLRSMFILACHDIVGSEKLQQVLSGIVDRIKALKADQHSGETTQKDLAEYCQAAYDDSPRRNLWQAPSPFENSTEAMRWLAFSASPLAEFSALSQDCILAWSQELVGSFQRVSGTTMGTPPTTGYTSSANVQSWPPLSVAPVGAHYLALQASLQDYMKAKIKISNDMREAARQMYYNQLNDLVESINTFHLEEFDADEAEDRYMGWCEDLEVINDELELLEASARRKERENLLAFLGDKMVEAGKAGLPDSDRALVALCLRFEQWYNSVGLLEEHWKTAGKVMTSGMELANKLQGATLPAQDADDAVMVSEAPRIPVFDAFCEAATDFTSLSSGFEQGIAAIKDSYAAWLAQPLTAEQGRQAFQVFANDNADLGEQLAGLLQLYLPHKENLLSAFQKTRALRDDIDSLITHYRNADFETGSWRMRTLYSLSNILHDVHDARIKTAAVLVDEKHVIIHPDPTAEDPSFHQAPSVAHAYQPEPALTWGITTAKKKLRDYLEKHKKAIKQGTLTDKRKLELSLLDDENKRIDALVAKLEAEALAQRTVIASFDGDEIEHFLAD